MSKEVPIGGRSPTQHMSIVQANTLFYSNELIITSNRGALTKKNIRFNVSDLKITISMIRDGDVYMLCNTLFGIRNFVTETVRFIIYFYNL